MRFCNDEHGVVEEFKKYNGIKEEIIYKSLSKQRTIYLYDDIDEDSEMTVNYMLEKLCVPEKDGKKLPIKMKMSTFGGDSYSAFSIVSAMESAISRGYEIQTFGFGKIMSAGVIIFAAGSPGKRSIQRWTRFLLHDVNSFLMGGLNSEEVSRISFDMKDNLDVYKKILLEKTKVPSKTFDEHVSKVSNWQFWSQDALKYKIADKLF